MTARSDSESVGSDCGQIGRDHSPACDDSFSFVVAICGSAILRSKSNYTA
jgi:hypothetical protein